MRDQFHSMIGRKNQIKGIVRLSRRLEKCDRLLVECTKGLVDREEFGRCFGRFGPMPVPHNVNRGDIAHEETQRGRAAISFPIGEQPADAFVVGHTAVE